MNRSIRTRGVIAATAVACLTAGALSACSSGGGAVPASPAAAAAPGASTVAKLASQVPAQYRTKTLVVGTDASVPPLEYQSPTGQILGFEPDVIAAAAAVLGLKVQFVNGGFPSLIPGLQNGRYDMIASDMGVHPPREKLVDMVHDFMGGNSVMVTKDSPLQINGLDGLCGVSVGAQTGSTYLADLTTQSGKCTAAGKKPVDIHSFSDLNAEHLALGNGRIQALMTDHTIANYATNQLHENVKVALTYYSNPCAISVAKDSGLAQPLNAAIQYLIDNGQYKQLLAKWQMSDQGIPSAVVNGIQ